MHGNVPQRWPLIYSEQGYAREKKTLERNLEKREAQLKKDIWHLGNEVFGCEKDAEGEVEKLPEEYPLYHLRGHMTAAKKFERKGKSATGDEATVAGYRLDLVPERNETAVEALPNKKGRFIPATNDMDAEKYPGPRMLEEYKEQQKVEGGFRFLKDPGSWWIEFS